MVYDNQLWRGGYFWEPSKNAVAPSQNQNSLKSIWGRDVMLWSHNEYAWGQRSILGHVWPLITSWPLTLHLNLWPHTYSLWPLRVTHAQRIDLWPYTHASSPLMMVSHPKIISKLFWFLLTWRNFIFAWFTKIVTESLLIVTHQWFLKWGKTRCWFI